MQVSKFIFIFFSYNADAGIHPFQFQLALGSLLDEANPTDEVNG